MEVKSIAVSVLLGEHFAILSTFIKLPFVIKIFVLSIFEWPLLNKTGFTVFANNMDPDQTLIRVHSVCFCDYLECIWICAVDILNRRQTDGIFWAKNICRRRVNTLPMQFLQ